LKAIGLAKGSYLDALAYLESQPGPRAYEAAKSVRLVYEQKAAVEAIDSSDLTPTPASVDFITTMAPLSAVRQLPLRRVPFATRLYDTTSMMVATQVDEGKGVPLTFGGFGQYAINSMKTHGGVIVTTKEFLSDMDEVAARGLANDLAGAVARAEDYTFLRDVSNGNPTVSSAGTSIANLDGDLKTALAYFRGDLRRAYWVLAPRTAAAIALMRGTAGAPAYPGLGATGGTLVGLPAIVSEGAVDDESSPADANIYLVDPTRIAFVDGGAELTQATQSTLQMDSEPTQSSVAPVTATQLVSMFQTNSVGLKALVWSAWHAAENSVVTIENVDL
jgi:HK97 family phage major capsid protein